MNDREGFFKVKKENMRSTLAHRFAIFDFHKVYLTLSTITAIAQMSICKQKPVVFYSWSKDMP